MDVLSDVIAAMRTGRPHSSRTHNRAPWDVWFEQFAGAGFHVVLRGTCWLFPADREPVALGVGDVAFLPHGAPHGLADRPDARPGSAASLADPPSGPETDGSLMLLCGAYLLEQARPHPVLADLPDVIVLPAQVGRQHSLRAAIDLLGTELAEARPGADGVLPALLDVLLLYILRAWYTDHGHGGWAEALADPVVSNALRAIHHEPGRQWTVEELGARSGLSRAPFARRFTALVGKPPLTYLTWWRMTVAAKLLRESDAPLRSVAERAGYTSEFAFAKAFKREYGVAPGHYRR